MTDHQGGAVATSFGFTVHVVPHTHWDREWYHPLGRFRQRLVELIDELLDDPLTDVDGGAAVPFLLDGQAVMLDDYLSVRPDRAPTLGADLRRRRIEAGPWYVLADELIPGGEALVRNLLAGRRTVARVGAPSPPVLYCPDSFGHPAALPTLAAGFGFRVAVVWRGYGGARSPAGDAAWWSGAGPEPDTVLLYHLPRAGYEFGSNLPTGRAAMEQRWCEMRGELAPRARLGHLLVQNGADHHARQRGLAEAFAQLEAVARPDDVRWSTLGEFAAAALGAATDLPAVRGELRDSYGYTWTLQGTFAARAAQKRRNAAAERLLVGEAEPWAALARRAGGLSRRPSLEAAWRTLLRCHPHDTLCGCSTDEVARAMDARLDSALAQATGIRDDALLDVLGHDPVEARERRADWRGVCVARNPVPRPRAGVVELEVETFIRDVAVGPGSAVRRAGADAVRGVPISLDAGRVPIQLLGRRLEQRRIESPRHYPDNDLVEVARVVALVPELRGYGTRSFVVDGATPAAMDVPVPVAVGDGTLDNGLLRLTVDSRGVARLSTPGGYESPALVSFEDVGDAGDLYTHSPTGSPITAAWFGGVRVVHRGPLRGELECRWRVRVPAGLRPDQPGEPLPPRRSRSGRPVELPVTVRFTLDALAPFLRVRVEGSNVANDHRFRVVFGTGQADARVIADAAFGPVERQPVVVAPEEAAMELPPMTAPLHRYVSLFAANSGVTLISDGLAEYEAHPDGRIAVTLVRAVGELSRNDLVERPGHAGWPVATPGAQCRGRFEAAFAVLPHGPHSAETQALIEQAAEDVLLPVTGSTLRSALAVPAPTMGAELRGRGLVASTLKESESGEWIVARCRNVTADEVPGVWRFGFPIREAQLARLDEQPVGPAPTNEDGELSFVAAPFAVVTLLVR